ncbi:D-aminoacylase [bacterium]|nr:MAG: D-aminoacylase [bacterium]
MILLTAMLLAPQGLVISGGLLYDGSGRPPVQRDVRVENGMIVAVGEIAHKPGDDVIEAKGMAVAPGFIDAHSHADGGIFEDRTAETQIRQGITTAVVGEDGGSAFPLKDWFTKLRTNPVAINFASFVGHGTVRGKVMGDSEAKSTPEERRKMAALVEEEMKSGALGLSTGLEYQPGRYADTDEVVELAKAARKHRGIYISHLRNEDNTALAAVDELITIAEKAKIPAQINHIKLGSARVWGQAGTVLGKMADARKRGLDITADIYPYLYWQSTIRVLIPTEDWDDRKLWEQGLTDVGGPGNVRLTSFSPDPSWAGKTIAEIATQTGKDAITVIQDIVTRTHRNGNQGSESVVVTAMSDDDVKTFMASPLVMFCSDGGLKGSHPRGAGSFPRILGVYVREAKSLTLSQAIQKMTSTPAQRFGFRDRGLVAKGKRADLVIFDPAKVMDTATVAIPQSAPIGIPTVIVNGVPVLRDGKVTGATPGIGLKRS